MLRYSELTSGDVEAVLTLRGATRENAISRERLYSDYGITHDTVANALTTTSRGWVCVDDDNIVGFAMGESARGEVTVLAVRPQFEGCGVGKTLLGLVQQWLFAHGHEHIWLHTSANPSLRAYGFYRHLGWIGSDIQGNTETLVLNRCSPALELSPSLDGAPESTRRSDR